MKKMVRQLGHFHCTTKGPVPGFQSRNDAISRPAFASQKSLSQHSCLHKVCLGAGEAAREFPA
jgi:hypothetical protein